jgi:hypothetical protein
MQKRMRLGAWDQPAARPFEQFQPDLMLQVGDQLADGGLGEPQQLTRAGDGAYQHHRAEGLQLPHVHRR